MTDNMRLWKAVEKTNPAHTKKVNQRGGFTAISAHYQIMQATEQFGPIGVGWGYDASHPIQLGDVVTVGITLWHGDRHNSFGPVWGAADLKGSNGRYDSDAPKKAGTDGLTKALSQLGFNADVFLGRFDDNKYVREMEQEFAEPKAEQPKKQPPLKGPIKTRAELRDACGSFVRELHACGDENMLYGFLTGNKALIDQVEAEAPFFWKGDGADFAGMAKEIEMAKQRVSEPSGDWRENPLNAG